MALSTKSVRACVLNGLSMPEASPRSLSMCPCDHLCSCQTKLLLLLRVYKDPPGPQSCGLGLYHWLSSLLTEGLRTCQPPSSYEPIPYNESLPIHILLALIVWRTLIYMLPNLRFLSFPRCRCTTCFCLYHPLFFKK